MGKITQDGEIDYLFNQADTDKNGSLSWDEFNGFILEREHKASKAYLHKAF